MEEPTSPLSETASRSAAALRELQARAQAVMSGRHDRFSQLETEITRQIDALTELLAAQKKSEAEAETSVGQRQAELANRQAQLDEQDLELRRRADQLDELERGIHAREA